MPELRHYLTVLRVRKWSVILVALLVIGTALALSFRTTPLYESRVEVLVREPMSSSPDRFSAEGPNLDTEKEIAESDAVATRVAREVQISPEQLAENLTVDVTSRTEILVFRYVDPSPAEAQRIAQLFAESYLEYRRQQIVDDLVAASEAVTARINELNAQVERLNRQVRETTDPDEQAALQSQATLLVSQVAILQQELADLTPPESLRVGQVVTPANLPRDPVKPNHLQDLLIATVAGVACGTAWAFTRERLDDSIRGARDLERLLGAPVLASIPRIPGVRRKQESLLICLTEPTSMAAEAYRSLRTGILFSMNQVDAKTLMITSAHAGDGKTVTACNLAVSLAQAGTPTLLISADLRRPRVHRFFDVSNQVGLTNVLAGELSPWQAVKQTSVTNLQLLLSGPIPGNPAELLGSPAMGKLLSALKETVDLVIIDAAPVLAVADAVTLAPQADALLFVVDPENSRTGAIDHARRQLDQVHARVIGSVLNNIQLSKARYGYYDYGYRYGGYRYGGYRYGGYRYGDRRTVEKEKETERVSRLPWRRAGRG